MVFGAVLAVCAVQAFAVQEPVIPTFKIATIPRPAFMNHGETNDAPVPLDADYVGPLADKCGVRFEYIVSPSWNRVIQMAKAGIADAIIPTTKLPGREAFLIFPETPYQQAPVVLFTNVSNPATEFSGLSMMNTKRVGKIAGTMIEQRFDAYLKTGQANFVEVSSFEDLFGNLARGRLDYAGGHQEMSLRIINQLGASDKIKPLLPPMGYEGRYFAISKTGKLAQDKLSAAYLCLSS